MNLSMQETQPLTRSYRNALFILFLLLVVLNAFAKDKPAYQDAVLVDFQTVSAGSTCGGNTYGNVQDNGTVDTTTSSTCSARWVRLYTLSVGEHTYTIRPALSGTQKATAVATLGWGGLFMKSSVLKNALPGTHVKVRTDGSDFYVSDGKRESLFTVVGAK